MSADNTPKGRTADELREEVATMEKKLNQLERSPAKNSMLAAATAVRLSELQAELATFEEVSGRGGVRVGSGDGIAAIDPNPDNGTLGQMAADELAETDLEDDSGPSARNGSLHDVLSSAWVIAKASAKQGSEPQAVIRVRTALDLIEPTYRTEDGLLWADEALTCIEQGDNTRAQWEKVADNLATLLPEGSDRHE